MRVYEGNLCGPRRERISVLGACRGKARFCAAMAIEQGNVRVCADPDAVKLAFSTPGAVFLKRSCHNMDADSDYLPEAWTLVAQSDRMPGIVPMWSRAAITAFCRAGWNKA